MSKTKSKSKKKSAKKHAKELALVKDLAQERWMEFVKQGRRSGASPETLNNMVCGEPSVLPPRKPRTVVEKKPLKIEKVAIKNAVDSILGPAMETKSSFANEGDSLFHVDLENLAEVKNKNSMSKPKKRPKVAKKAAKKSTKKRKK